MPNGEMQLIAYGSQDIYLTGNPTITFFKYMYQRHTNFATEYIRQDFESLPNFNTESSNVNDELKINANKGLEDRLKNFILINWIFRIKFCCERSKLKIASQSSTTSM